MSTWARRLATLASSGALMGVFAQLLDEWSELTGALASYTSFYIAGIAWLGWRAPTRMRALVGAAVCLICLVGAYYVTFRLREGGSPWTFIVLWLVAALTAGPALALAGRIAAERGRRSAMLHGLIVGLLVGEAAILLVGSVTVVGFVWADWQATGRTLAGVVAAALAVGLWWGMRRAIPVTAGAGSRWLGLLVGSLGMWAAVAIVRLGVALLTDPRAV